MRDLGPEGHGLEQRELFFEAAPKTVFFWDVQFLAGKCYVARNNADGELGDCIGCDGFCVLDVEKAVTFGTENSKTGTGNSKTGTEN
jgi:hypothetical protein